MLEYVGCLASLALSGFGRSACPMVMKSCMGSEFTKTLGFHSKKKMGKGAPRTMLYLTGQRGGISKVS